MMFSSSENARKWLNILWNCDKSWENVSLSSGLSNTETLLELKNERATP